ncbi:MAG: DMT family transporter [Proteocatella sp.]|jgi:drug/metabolite transporter (DMT)-like permease|nr:DMT family transporter [Proteocatella sp.]MBP7907573.1 DMT family transporter [Proteocatella sp.]MBP9658474.1 DMT family transporter [Proteocatella sp.]MBP9966448.1 DMT family transporter [Proteocatella sp.]
MDRTKKQVLFADLGLLLVALLWGAGFLFTKRGLDYITPLWMMSMRFVGATIIMSIVFYKNFRKISKSDLKAGLIIGIFLYIAFATQTIGLQYTSISNQAFLTATNVVFVPFLVWVVYKKAPDKFAFIGAALATVGIGLITLKEGLHLNVGDMWTLACAVFFAGHIVSIGFFAKDKDPIALTIVQFAVAAVLSLVSALMMEPLPAKIGSEAMLSVGYMVLASTLLAFLLQNICQKYTPSTHASLILSLESVFGTLVAVIFEGEMFNLQMAFGCITVFAAILLIETRFEFLGFGKKESSEIKA